MKNHHRDRVIDWQSTPDFSKLCYSGTEPAFFLPGQIVKIPFGRRGLIWGIIKSKKNTPTIKNFQLKYITQIHDAPSLSKEYLKFFDWVCAWTMTNPGQLAKMILPNSKKKWFNVKITL